jgi:hypothetical protein
MTKKVFWKGKLKCPNCRQYSVIRGKFGARCTNRCGINECDKCLLIDHSEELIWITSDDFEPRRNEHVPEKAYETYDALCEDCYLSILVEPEVIYP